MYMHTYILKSACVHVYIFDFISVHLIVDIVHFNYAMIELIV